MGPVRVALRIALAHHPVCAWFRSDVVRVAGRALCAGCAWAVPGFMVGLAAAYLALVRGAVEPLPLGTASLAFGVPQAVTYVRRGSRPQRAAAKVLGGFGLGSFTVAAVALGWTVLTWTAFVATLAASLMQLVRMRRIRSTCRACPWQARWEECPGFGFTA